MERYLRSLLIALMLLVIGPFGIREHANAVCLFSCNDLDRDKAAAILGPLNYGVVTVTLDVGVYNLPGGFIGPNADLVMRAVQTILFGSEADKNAELQRADVITRGFHSGLGKLRTLAQKGMVTSLDWKQVQYSPTMKLLSFRPMLRDDVRASCVQPGSFICQAVIAKWKFGTVTGITGEGNSRIVQFNIISEPTDVGKALGANPATQARAARFQLFDDGWRLAQ